MQIQATITEKALAQAPIQLPQNLGFPGMGIPFIVVKLVGGPGLQNYTNSTDAQGKFSFEVPQGSYTLQIRSPIHKPYSRVVNRDFIDNIALERTAY